MGLWQHMCSPANSALISIISGLLTWIICCDSVIKGVSPTEVGTAGDHDDWGLSRFELAGVQLFSAETKLTNGNFGRKVKWTFAGWRAAGLLFIGSISAIARCRNQFHVSRLTTWRLWTWLSEQRELRQPDEQPAGESTRGIRIPDKASSVVKRRATHKCDFNSLQCSVHISRETRVLYAEAGILEALCLYRNSSIPIRPWNKMLSETWRSVKLNNTLHLVSWTYYKFIAPCFRGAAVGGGTLSKVL